ncbi:hypothetical protein LSH36_102g03004 [Paralvinella palmiformis]|uniref:Uncharacterized protein n=1 Tax=Paralvinella palmiformis TaxID=53620 RepID=A0AAD9JZY6_9ANNE|nr:hypothetical protein LSH36_102g03004 [Paralvinella palmiformis]
MEERRMSNYGRKSPTVIEVTGIWKEDVRHENIIHKSHLSYKGDGTRIWPGTAKNEEHLLENAGKASTYFHKLKQHKEVHIFDRLFHPNDGYNMKLHRDDREHTMGLDISAEEEVRPVPVRSSSQYGRYINKPHETPSREYARVERVQKGFYRSRGTGIPTSSSTS